MENRVNGDGESPQLSVVVPVYNVESFLAECLDSILAQTFDDFEVLCINDGSTDRSLEIMREYADRDDRVRIIDKPNGGYGHSVNRGISEARGEYVSIVEPDDLIERHMFEDLLANATFGGAPADIVKSSYWNYYALDGSEPYVRKPNLMKRMPQRRMRFTVHSNWEVLYHHPSIWSAIYRREFLEEKGIRLIEPKGAGWADNPFFFETLCQAESIVWVPAAYYLYRQTNPESSSYLKDYHLPFDRLRDIRAILDWLGERDSHVLVCLYNRTFSYVRSVLEKFGYPESDPELFSLIREAFESMDPDLVFGAKRGLKDLYVDYYKDVMGYSARRFSRRASRPSPRVSVVVPMRNSRPLLYRCFESIARQTEMNIEVLCVDLGSQDRSLDVARAVAARDARFVPIPLGENTLRGLIGAVSTRSRSGRICFVDPSDEIDKHHVSEVRHAFEESGAPLLLLGSKFPYVAGAPKRGSLTLSCQDEDRFASLCASIGSGSSHLAISQDALKQILSNDACEGAYCYPVLAFMALVSSQNAAAAIVPEPRRMTYELMESPLALLNRSTLRASSRLLNASGPIGRVYSENEGLVSHGAQALMVELFVQDWRDLSCDEERSAYPELARSALAPFELPEASPASLPNVGSLQTMMECLSSEIPNVGPDIRSSVTQVARLLARKSVNRGVRLLPTSFYKIIRAR